MGSVHKVKGSPYWHCFFAMPNGRRTHKSTGCKDKKSAARVCLAFSEAAQSARLGDLNEEKAHKVIADIFAAARKEGKTK